ncbi:hypothetical protein D3C76_585580 [compost metagenome]
MNEAHVGTVEPNELQQIDVSTGTTAVIDNVVAIVSAIQVNIAAATTGQKIIPGATIQAIIAGVTRHVVGQAITGAVEVAAAGQFQIFKVGAQAVVHRRSNGISAVAGLFGGDVRGLLYDVNIVATASCHVVVASATVEQIVAGVAFEVVIPGAALQRVIAIAAL